MAEEVRDNPEEHRFEMMVEGQRAEAYYTLDGKVMTFTHTDVPQVLSGRGIGSRLIKGALDQVRARQQQLLQKLQAVEAQAGSASAGGDEKPPHY